MFLLSLDVNGLIVSPDDYNAGAKDCVAKANNQGSL